MPEGLTEKSWSEDVDRVKASATRNTKFPGTNNGRTPSTFLGLRWQRGPTVTGGETAARTAIQGGTDTARTAAHPALPPHQSLSGQTQWEPEGKEAQRPASWH